MREYFLEVRSDEIPSRLLRPAMKQLGTRLFEELMGRGLGPEAVVSGLSQRRFVLCYRGLPDHEPDREERELGPPASEAYTEDGKATEALAGFAERVGVDAGELVAVKTEKGEYVALVRQVAGRPLADALAAIVPRALGEIRWLAPKLRSGVAVDSAGANTAGANTAGANTAGANTAGANTAGANTAGANTAGAWIRPVRGIVSLLDGEVLHIELGGKKAGRETAGHPILSPEPFAVEGFDDYRAKLAALGIEISFEARRETLQKALAEHAAELGGRLPKAPGLLDRLALRCEIPGVVEASIDGEFLSLTPEIVSTVLRERQAAFALTDGEALLPRFLTVMDRPDDPLGMVRAGQEWAAAGHLGDARFHYENDRTTPLARRARRLDQLEVHPGLGHYAEKSRRVRALAELIAGEIGWSSENEIAAVRDAASLAKADLTTSMGRDFPSLRGRLGGLYAREEGYVESVWQAIYDQYLPASLDDPIPRGPVGRAVGLADRLDDLVGFFGIGEAATGSKDPHGLRRKTLGVFRILIESGAALDLDLVAARAVLLYNEERRVLERGAEEIVKDLQGFFKDRLRQLLGQRGHTFDEIEAALAVGGTANLPDLELRLAALSAVREEPWFRSLVLAAKRIFNIVKGSSDSDLQPELLQEEAEKDLYAELVDVRRAVDEAADRRDYPECLRRMADLVDGLERFFAEVLVMDEDESRRNNRMALLQACRRVFWRIGRIKEMAVERAEPAEDEGK